MQGNVHSKYWLHFPVMLQLGVIIWLDDNFWESSLWNSPYSSFALFFVPFTFFHLECGCYHLGLHHAVEVVCGLAAREKEPRSILFLVSPIILLAVRVVPSALTQYLLMLRETSYLSTRTIDYITLMPAPLGEKYLY